MVVAGEGSEEDAFSSSEGTRVEELGEEDLAWDRLDCMWLVKVGGAEAECWR